MVTIGLIRERKVPADNRVALTPAQCAEIMKNYSDIKILVESSPDRCFTDEAYAEQGIEVVENMNACDILLGIKEVPVDMLIEGKTYLFFSHTKKEQPYNKPLMQALIQKGIRMVDYECMTHDDEQRILGFGLFAGIVGAHNGLLTYGKKTEAFSLPEAYKVGDYKVLTEMYHQTKLPPVKIAITGSGRVSAGIVEVMTNLDIDSIEPEDFRTHEYDYPVYTQLKGASLYARKDNDEYYRDDFHANPGMYKCLFSQYIPQTDILMNGIYWDEDIPRLFQAEDIRRKDWRINTIADITCDIHGSVPINVGATSIQDPVYGIDRDTLKQTNPYMPSKQTVDVMAVDNLPNELPKDASAHFGAHFEKFILGELLKEDSKIIERATICKHGKLTKEYEYLHDYAYN